MFPHTHDLLRLYQTGDEANIEIVLQDGRKIKAHSSILMTMSKFFNQRLDERYGFTESRTKIIHLVDDPAWAVEAMVAFCYCQGCFCYHEAVHANAHSQEVPGPIAADVEMTLLGVKYGIPRLERRAGHNLQNTVGEVDWNDLMYCVKRLYEDMFPRFLFLRNNFIEYLAREGLKTGTPPFVFRAMLLRYPRFNEEWHRYPGNGCATCEYKLYLFSPHGDMYWC